MNKQRSMLRIGLTLSVLVSLANSLLAQVSDPARFDENGQTVEKKVEMTKFNARLHSVNKPVQTLLKRARELADAGHVEEASKYYERAATIQRAVFEFPADLYEMESLVAQGKYSAVVGIGRQYSPTFGSNLFMIISNCEIGDIKEARKVLEANEVPLGLRHDYSFEFPIASGMTCDAMEATAWLLLERNQGALHSAQCRLNWLQKANSLAKHNPLIELRMAELLNGSLKRPREALALLDDAKRQMGNGQLAAGDPLLEVERQHAMSVDQILYSTLQAQSVKNR